ncbi:MAG: PH domain-containing protein [Microbacterium sp.]|nr:PH domain-containing protein [Microbacterium sp.]
MTNSPEFPDSTPTIADPAGAPSGPQGALDSGTFDRILEPRSPRRLPLGDGTWHQLARSYVWVRLISLALFLAVVLVAAFVLALLTRTAWPWIPGGVLSAGIVWAAAITPRQARAFGYQLRSDDLVFRRGILWQRMVAVPYGRMQLVDITHGPLDRAFGIAQLKLVTAAAATGVVIPGLTQDAAEHLRDTLIDVAEARRTGL